MFVLLGLMPFLAYSQPLSSEAKISLITCDPGNEIYSLHGHSAIRVQDPSSNMDLICNWGVFDPGDSELDFSISFAKGKMDYLLDLQSFASFKLLYEMEQRGMREMELNLTETQKKQMWEYILQNNMPENRAYRYDFFFANCANNILVPTPSHEATNFCSKTDGPNGSGEIGTAYSPAYPPI